MAKLRNFLAKINVSAAIMLASIACIGIGIALRSRALALIVAGGLVWLDIFVENLISKIRGK